MPARFRLLWAATAVSNLGDGVRLAALPLLATELTRDPVLIAGVAVADRLPWLVFILPGGAWADRHDRRRLRVGLDLARAVTVAVLAVLIAVDAASMWAVYIVTAMLASSEAIVDSSAMALVPSLVGDHQLESAGGRLAGTELVMNGLIGPVVGGLLFTAALWAPFGVDAVSFVVAAVLASSIPGSFRVARTESSASRSMISEIAEGMRWLWHQRLLRDLALISTALGTIGFATGAVAVVLARDEFGLGPLGYSVLLIPPAIGGLIGSYIAPLLRPYPLGRVLTLSVLATGLTSLGIAATEHIAVVALLFAMEAGAVVIWNVLTLALRQRTIPDELLGRVGASYRSSSTSACPRGH